MANTSTDAEIRTRIDSFLSELSGLVRKAALESVHEALGGGSAPGRQRGPGRPRGSGRRGPGRPRKAGRRTRASKRIRRSAADLEKIAARVLAHVKSNAGQRLEQIGKALKVDTAVLKRPVANLLAAKKLRTKGQRRGSMYFTGGGGGGAKKTAKKARRRVRRPAKRTRKATPKRSARRAAPRIVKRAPAQKKKTARKASRRTPPSNAIAVSDALTLQAAMPTAPM